MVNGPFKNTGLAKFLRNFSGLAVSIFAWMSASQSLEFLQGSLVLVTIDLSESVSF